MSDQYDAMAFEFIFFANDQGDLDTSTADLAALLRQVAADERDACARVCEELDRRWWQNQSLSIYPSNCAAAIRARSTPSGESPS